MSKNCFQEAVDCILGIRDDIGVALADVFLVERKWSGERPGDGSYTDTSIQLTPTPEIVDYSHDIRASEAGAIKSGDLILRSISKSQYIEDDLRTDTGIQNIQRFVKVGEHYYRTIHVKEKLVTWDIHVRKVSQDENEEKPKGNNRRR